MDAFATPERFAVPQPCFANRVTQRFDPEKWTVYRDVLLTAQKRAVPFAAGGGLATMVYTAQARPSKDLDLFILGRDRDAAIRVLNDCGLADLYDKQPYDRSWIYRGHSNGTIVDVIWEMANHRSPVDRVWLEKGPEICIEEVRMRLVPAEETLWSKLYILQYDRCDWPDALSLLYVAAADLDWHRLLERLGEDRPLLAGLLSVFRWVAPGRTRRIPAWVWRDLNIEPQDGACPDAVTRRANLLDSRPWFTPALPEAGQQDKTTSDNEQMRDEQGVSKRC